MLCVFSRGETGDAARFGDERVGVYSVLFWNDRPVVAICTWCKQGVDDGCGLLFHCGAVEARNCPQSLH